MEKLAILEAMLFMSPNPVSNRKLMKAVGEHNSNKIKSMVEELNKIYEERNSPIRIFEKEDGYIMNIFPKYAEYVKSFALETEITKGETRVLGYIAKHKGILKSTVVKRLGPVYEKIKSLEEKGFVKEEPDGRSSKLFTTKKFKDYFGDMKDL
ncbi:SMC-Scp complex subunit ScpB [Candidatus Micrarchaeota archaeon]|jgi:segregation and condensation protein B|nr:SMC-Scp complex subunit ScpB [Candidatus Micrarchaeota archaeon]